MTAQNGLYSIMLANEYLVSSFAVRSIWVILVALGGTATAWLGDIGQGRACPSARTSTRRGPVRRSSSIQAPLR